LAGTASSWLASEAHGNLWAKEVPDQELLVLDTLTRRDPTHVNLTIAGDMLGTRGNCTLCNYYLKIWTQRTQRQ
jgi:hypothetical protein